MKRLFCLLCCIVLACPCIARASGPDYADDEAYGNFYGRLYIPDVGIDVALYRSSKQLVVDRQDSAAFFSWGYIDRYVIADHNTQAFATLKDVQEGTTGYIATREGRTIHIECVRVLDGYNTGQKITDKNWHSVLDDAWITMYTCLHGWRNVRICQWEETKE